VHKGNNAMPFNSLTYFVFFFLVLTVYFFLNHRLQNLLLLFASYVFYAWWDWRFLSLILAATVVSFFCGLLISYQKTDREKKKW